MDDYQVLQCSPPNIWRSSYHVLSYLWVLETNTGATWRAGYLRIVSRTDPHIAFKIDIAGGVAWNHLWGHLRVYCKGSARVFSKT